MLTISYVKNNLQFCQCPGKLLKVNGQSCICTHETDETDETGDVCYTCIRMKHHAKLQKENL